MKYKLWVRRMSISAPKMTVKSHYPWPLKALFLVLVLGFGGAIALWIYDLGRDFTGHSPVVSKQQLADLNEKVGVLTAERDRFSSTVNAAESRLNIEKAAQEQLGQQIKVLETENAKLKEDLAFFEGLLPNATGSQGITIQRLTAELLTPTQLRYRMLIMQGGKGANFVGNVQLLVTATVAGKSTVLIFPGASATAAEKTASQLDFKYYQRVEAELTLPEGAVVKAIQAKVMEKGQMRAQQTSNL
ncbi:MAG: hypothetical protein JWQ61_3364 [Collimonas fungivorans]|uniref:DUF6776 family protein n=1 Tax=Collimonas fungivorans TaxID=158899 RepID=UPI0026ED39BD|nr:DUF6776 family protein [Collimonas fungivorans]MDB5768550.1 hypothetical protein [Collimonas fungivorans]